MKFNASFTFTPDLVFKPDQIASVIFLNFKAKIQILGNAFAKKNASTNFFV